ncbi:MAG TPA: GH25 family lysozyme [Jiangellaceae bacterium]|nr:GH25 family lysozyme [Jiangellaceae bacterium]
MTAFLLDVSRWQHPIDLARARDEGYALVNVQLTGKAGYVFPHAREYVDKARALGMGVCVYHWLDGRASGALQAERTWRSIEALGGDLAHQVDCEDTESPATWPIWRDYVNAMQNQLQRHVINYSGDWFWDHPDRRWPGSTLTPYHWAMPNRGALDDYPGDTSSHWLAGYGGWTSLAIMQYAVAPAAGVRCSLSAVRDHTVWTTLTGGPMVWYLNRALSTMRSEVNTRWSQRDKGSDGTIGDAAHASRSSDHNPDPDGSVDAWDMDVDLRSGNDAAAIEFIKARFQAHPASLYWIHADVICRRADNWLRRSYPAYLESKGVDPSGRNTHTKHVHWNSREAYEDSSAPWGILEEDVNLEDPLWTVPAGHPSGLPAGVRTVKEALIGADSRTALLANTGFIKNLIDGLKVHLDAKLLELEEDVNSPMDAATRALLVAEFSAAANTAVAALDIPTTAEIADAVADESAARLAD